MEHTEHLEHTESPADIKKQIWRTFWILSFLTVIDIVLYFALLSYHSMWKNTLFILLGVVKAFYIVAVFMHMKFERKALAGIIILPFLLVLVLIWLVLIECGYTFDLR